MMPCQGARQIADQLGHARPSLTQDVYMGRKAKNPAAADALETDRWLLLAPKVACDLRFLEVGLRMDSPACAILLVD